MANPHAELSDAVLVTGVARGDKNSLAEIYRRHGGPAFRLASRVLNDQRLAEDICQDVFLTLWNSPEMYDAERGTLRSWLLMKTHGRSVDSVRASAARFNRENRELNDPSARDYDLEREVWDLTVADRIQRALTELPPNEKDAVRLAYFGGLTYREVAAQLGEPEGTVKSRIRTGLKNLGRLLHDLQGESAPESTIVAMPDEHWHSGDGATRPNANKPKHDAVSTKRNRWGR